MGVPHTEAEGSGQAMCPGSLGDLICIRGSCLCRLVGGASPDPTPRVMTS